MVKLELDERDVVQVSRRLHRVDEIAKQDDMEWMHEVTGLYQGGVYAVREGDDGAREK